MWEHKVKIAKNRFAELNVDEIIEKVGKTNKPIYLRTGRMFRFDLARVYDGWFFSTDDRVDLIVAPLKSVNKIVKKLEKKGYVYKGGLFYVGPVTCIHLNNRAAGLEYSFSHWPGEYNFRRVYDMTNCQSHNLINWMKHRIYSRYPEETI